MMNSVFFTYSKIPYKLLLNKNRFEIIAIIKIIKWFDNTWKIFKLQDKFFINILFLKYPNEVASN